MIRSAFSPGGEDKQHEIIANSRASMTIQVVFFPTRIKGGRERYDRDRAKHDENAGGGGGGTVRSTRNCGRGASREQPVRRGETV